MLVYSDKSAPSDLPRDLEDRDKERSQTLNAIGLVLNTFIPRISVRVILLPRSCKHQHAQLLLESFAWHLLATNPNKDFYGALVELAGRVANPARLPFNGPEISFTVEAEETPQSAHDQIQALHRLQDLINLPGRDAESIKSWYSKRLRNNPRWPLETPHAPSPGDDMIIICDTTAADSQACSYQFDNYEVTEICTSLFNLSKILVPHGMKLDVRAQPENQRRALKNPWASASVSDKYERTQQLPHLYSEMLSQLACHIVHPARMPHGTPKFHYSMTHPVNVKLTAHEYLSAYQSMLAITALPGRDASYIKEIADNIRKDMPEGLL